MFFLPFRFGAPSNSLFRGACSSSGDKPPTYPIITFVISTFVNVSIGTLVSSLTLGSLLSLTRPNHGMTLSNGFGLDPRDTAACPLPIQRILLSVRVQWSRVNSWLQQDSGFRELCAANFKLSSYNPSERNWKPATWVSVKGMTSAG